MAEFNAEAQRSAEDAEIRTFFAVLCALCVSAFKLRRFFFGWLVRVS